MEIDSPATDFNSIPPRDRIVQRLVKLGVPQELLDHLQHGLVAFVKENKSRIPELVSAILPTDEEVAETVLRAKAGRSRNFVGGCLRVRFRESMVWLQWLMFEGDPGVALNNLANRSVGERGVCGAVWGNNDIAYRCRTCEHDPTCAICVPCFQNGNHKEHDYSIIYTGGGCCDCGDVTAWKREGFCSKHKGAEQIQPLPVEYANSVGPIIDALLLCWKNKLLSAEAVYSENPRESDRVSELRKAANEMTFVIVEMLLEFCKQSESLLSFVSGKVSSFGGLLDILVRSERFLSDVVLKKLHELLLKLLGEPIFKYEFAKVFLNYYPIVVDEAIKVCNNDAVLKKYPLLSTFSVQIFTVPTLTPRLVKEMNLLAMLLGCLGDIFISCAGEDGRLQVTKWGNLYETTLRVVEDTRFVMSHGEVPKYVTHEQRDISRTWMRLLAFVQGMNPQKRETGFHIEEENEDMHLPFILGRSIANIHSHLADATFSVVNAEEADDGTLLDSYKQDLDDRDGLRHAKVGRLSQESSICSSTGKNVTLPCASKVTEGKSDSVCYLQVPSSVTWLTFECLRAIENWLSVDDTSGSLLNVLSPKTSNISGSDFLALKKTLSNIRKGKYIFSKLTSSSKVNEWRHFSPLRTSWDSSIDLESGQLIGQGSESMMSGEVGSDNVGITAALDDCAMEGQCTIESEPLRVLSLSDWPDILYDVSSQDISVHIPLHRLLSLLLQKSLRTCFGEAAMPNVSGCRSLNPLSAIPCDFFGHVLGGCQPYGFSAFVMEHPLRIRVFCAEVHAGMWRKNGDAAILSCEWYRSVRWSEQSLELDLFLLQCCAALAPADLYVNRILERFGLSKYLSLNLEQSSEYESALLQEMLTLLIQIVKERRFCGLTTAECLKRELIYKLVIGDATHSQLVKSLPRDLSKNNQLQEILDNIAAYSHPSGIKQGMYSLRWTYWKELDLYHPRWNPRDLQVAEERYLRFCSASALTSQLPRWTKIYHPLSGVARIATCKVVLQIIRTVLFYAVFTEKSTASRAPDGVLLTALHLLSLSLDICSLQRESSDRSCYIGDSIPMLAFAGEDIGGEVKNRFGEQNLLSLLVLLMRMHKKEDTGSFMEAGNCDLSSFIGRLLKKFAEIDSGCMIRLQKLAPEVVNDYSPSVPGSDANIFSSASDSEKRRAKARDRQAAILAKMKAEQSKFMASIDSTSDDRLNGSKSGQDVRDSNVEPKSEDSTQDTCSLCHDPSSKDPVSFLILLQKSRLVSSVDKGPPSWDKVPQLDKDIVTSNVIGQFENSIFASTSGMISPSQLLQNAVNEFARGRPSEVNAFLEFIKARFPLVRSIQRPCSSSDSMETTAYSSETLEGDMFSSIWREIQISSPNLELVYDDKTFLSAKEGTENRDAQFGLLGQYIAFLSRERTENSSSFQNAPSHDEQASLDSNAYPSSYDGFGPLDSDGIHLSSCGHAVHQGCLDRYLTSLKERSNRRIVFEGGHIVDPDQGEFLCPVCRRLANSVLPALSEDSHKVGGVRVSSDVGSSHAASHMDTSNREINVLRVRQALTLLQSAKNMVEKSEVLQLLPMHTAGRIKTSLEPVLGVLFGMYFPGKMNKFSESANVSHLSIMWDTLKYSLMSTEIAARSGRTYVTPTYSLDSLYKELGTSGEFILSLLLKIVQSRRSKDPIQVILRFSGIQLFTESICSTSRRGENVLSILKHVERDMPHPDFQFLKRASDPILARDPFSSLMWVLFCLPCPFLSCEESFSSLVHIFYLVSVAQAISTYCAKRRCKTSEMGFHDCMISDISKVMESGVAQQYFVSNFIDPSCNINDIIRSLSFPYLRRCALLWKLMGDFTSAPFWEGAQLLERSSNALDDMMDPISYDVAQLIEVENLEKMFKIPPLDVVLKDEMLRSLVLKWFHHICSVPETHNFRSVLHCTPAVPFKLMHLPDVYQDILQRYIKQRCPDCKAVLNEPALCLLCGRLCSPSWKSCCRENGCQTHAMACGAGTGVFLLIRKTTILLQRSARQAPWPSPYLDAFGEEDVEMHRGKPLFLNEERYATLSYLVASHGLDRSSKVLRQTTIGFPLMV